GQEGIKRDANRKNDVKGGETGMVSKGGQESLKAVSEKVEVLEEAKHAKVDRHAAGQQPLPPGGPLLSLDPKGQVIVEEVRSEEESDKPWIPPPVKDVTGRQEHPVLPSMRQPVIEGQHRCQENQEGDGIEQHVARNVGGGII